MNAELHTVVIPFAAPLAQVECELSRTWGNPIRDPDPQRRDDELQTSSERIARFVDQLGVVHFMGIHALPGEGKTHHLVIELALDGSFDYFLEQLTTELEPELRQLFESAKLSPPRTATGLADFLRHHVQTLALGWRAKTPGLGFCGTPGFSVERIRSEAKLERHVCSMLAELDPKQTARQRLEQVREKLWRDPHQDWKWVFEPASVLSSAVETENATIVKSIPAFVRELLWPLLPLPCLFFALALWWNALWAWAAMIAVIAGELALLVGVYQRLRRQEATDLEDSDVASAKNLRDIGELEDRATQNHLIVLTPLKPGWLRRLALRFALFVVRQAATYNYPQGKLGDISTIHVARWIVLPKSSQLLFMSNYGGSWESYLEDFIIKAHLGLTGIWSNTQGFPRASNLFFDGATRGAEFKTWARRQQRPTRCWYTGYPTLTTGRIRANADVRRGLAEAQSHADAARWLALFGAPNATHCETEQIQALVFGGLPRLRYGRAVLLRFSDKANARAWLNAVHDQVGHGDHAGRSHVIQIGFTSTGLAKLGVNERTLSTFSIPFQHGSAARARLLGDSDETRAAWAWSDDSRNGVDALALVYHVDLPGLTQDLGTVTQAAETVHSIELEPRPNTKFTTESFGFVDGVSQPVLRGTRKAERATTPDQLVALGEVVLGYPDDSGFTPPAPKDADGGMDVDIGRNGTYLVVRQLEQDKQGFDDYLDNQAADPKLKDALPRTSPEERKEWIAAKMMGRWRDGASLVRHPRRSTNAHAGAARPANSNHEPDNDFRFGAEDPDGLRCPYGAHIRRANPRDSFDPKAAQPLQIVNRHRILRVGRSYQEGGVTRGLLFMCLNADIERQFEFIQQSWMLAPSFHGLPNEMDPILGGAALQTQAACMTVPTQTGPIALSGISKFVTVRGSGYFFMPSRACLEHLAKHNSAPQQTPLAAE